MFPLSSPGIWVPDDADHPGSSSRGQHAELVAIGVGHDYPRDISLADINAFGSLSKQPVDLGSLIAITRGDDVQMQSILILLGVPAEEAQR